MDMSIGLFKYFTEVKVFDDIFCANQMPYHANSENTERTQLLTYNKTAHKTFEAL